MDFINKNKKIFLYVGILAAVIVVYFMFFSGTPAASVGNPLDPTMGGLVSDISMSPADTIVGRDLLAMLAKLKTVSLDTSFFNDSAFLSLQDKSRTLQPEPLGKAVGRQNPFSDFAKGVSSTFQATTSVSH